MYHLKPVKKKNKHNRKDRVVSDKEDVIQTLPFLQLTLWGIFKFIIIA